MNDLDDGIKSTLNKLADDTNLGGTADALEQGWAKYCPQARTSPQRDLKQPVASPSVLTGPSTVWPMAHVLLPAGIQWS